MVSLENPFTFVEEGGTRIIVTHKDNRVVGMVSPHAMALASPVWKKFIFPPFRQMPSNSDTAIVFEKACRTKNIDDIAALKTAGTTESSEPVVAEQIASIKLKASNPSVEPTEEIDFAEDPAEALLILLNITHFRFTKVPLKIPLQILSDIANLCDQYDWVNLVKPWLSQWLVDETTGWKPAPGVVRGSIQEKWLYIAWVFGREQVLKDCASSLVRSLYIYDEGDCAHLKCVHGPMPPGLLESICRVRRASIEKALAIFNKCINRFTSNSRVLCLHRDVACDAMIYGSLLRGLQIHEIYPNMDAVDLDISLDDLTVKLSALKVHVSYQYGRYIDHSNCFATDLVKELDAVQNEIQDPVLESHIRHMEVQRAKLNGEN